MKSLPHQETSRQIIQFIKEWHTLSTQEKYLDPNIFQITLHTQIPILRSKSLQSNSFFPCLPRYTDDTQYHGWLTKTLFFYSFKLGKLLSMKGIFLLSFNVLWRNLKTGQYLKKIFTLFLQLINLNEVIKSVRHNLETRFDQLVECTVERFIYLLKGSSTTNPLSSGENFVTSWVVKPKVTWPNHQSWIYWRYTFQFPLYLWFGRITWWTLVDEKAPKDHVTDPGTSRK